MRTDHLQKQTSFMTQLKSFNELRTITFFIHLNHKLTCKNLNQGLVNINGYANVLSNYPL